MTWARPLSPSVPLLSCLFIDSDFAALRDQQAAQVAELTQATKAAEASAAAALAELAGVRVTATVREAALVAERDAVAVQLVNSEERLGRAQELAETAAREYFRSVECELAMFSHELLIFLHGI